MATISEAFAIAIQHFQGGRLQAAEQIYRQILAVEPNHPDALHFLGMIASRAGKHRLAVEYIEHAIKVYGSAPFFHNNLGEAYRALGRLSEAVASYRRAIELEPDFVDAHYNLGNALKDQELDGEAVASYRRALALRPDHAETHNNLGVVFRKQGKLDEAVACYRRALELNPTAAEVHNNLGVALRERTISDEVVACFRRALELSPNAAEIHNNLGVALKDLGKFDESAACCRRALELKPDFAEAHSNLGNALKEQGKLEEAVTCCHRAIELTPGFAGAHNNLGTVFEEQGKLDESLACYRRALELKPDFAEAYGNLGSVQVEMGDFQAAEGFLRAALRHDRRLAFAHSKLAELLGGRLPEEDLDAQLRLLKEAELTDAQRLSLHFGLAQVLDARGDYAGAAHHSSVANALRAAQWKLAGQEYDAAAHSEFVNRIIAEFTPEFFVRVRGFGVETERPVFIVGLPRSGTTLIEQILASHSHVFGAGELPLAREAYAAECELEKQSQVRVVDWDRDRIQRIALRYLDELQRRNATALRVVDKMPDNHLYLGFLAAILPRARFIHCRRDYRDVAVSCWMANFRTIRWANLPGSIAARIHDYQRLMDRWRDVLPAPILDVSYEETVTDLEAVARRLLAWCGLEWEPNCLEFHRTKRPIRTASAVQVRQPLFRTSVERWKHYEQALGPLFARLGDALRDLRLGARKTRNPRA